MDERYHMTKADNIFTAKRNIVDYIYKSARLEGIAVTFPQTEAVYAGGNAASLSRDDIVVINNLKHAWQFVLDTVVFEENIPPTDYRMICQINKIVGANLFYREDWLPEMPQEDAIRGKTAQTPTIAGTTERALNLMLDLMRRQMFVDGNKRTAMLAANREMILGGAGIISIPVPAIAPFREKLIRFYESGKKEDILLFLYENAIDGMNLPPLSEIEDVDLGFGHYPSMRNSGR